MDSFENKIQQILNGRDVRTVLFEEDVVDDIVVDEPIKSTKPTEQFAIHAEEFNKLLLRKYDFVKSVDPEIDQYTKYIENFFIRIYTKLSWVFPEQSVAEYNLEKDVLGSTTQYGIGGPKDVDVSTSDLAKSVMDLFYKDAFSVGLVPVDTKHSYSIMKYNNTSKFYGYEKGPNDTLVLRMEFYTDRGMNDNE